MPKCISFTFQFANLINYYIFIFSHNSYPCSMIISISTNIIITILSGNQDYKHITIVIFNAHQGIIGSTSFYGIIIIIIRVSTVIIIVIIITIATSAS